MGKKKIIQKSGEETLKGSEAATATKKREGSTAKSRILNGRIYIQASYNNTLVTVTDDKGNVVTWMSAGSMGFSGPKKATPFAASKVAEAIAEKIGKTGPANVEVYLRGVGKGRDAAIRSFAAKGLNIMAIKDVTPIPHNGPRPRKIRRV